MSSSLIIVVADDERDTREYLQELLSRLGHEVLAAEDGRQLVDLCRVACPDLVVTDYAMPGLDGVAASVEVNRARAVPVILISGRHEAALLADAVGSALVKVLAKPIKERDLCAAIERVTAGPETRDG